MRPRRPRLIAIATATVAAMLAGCGTISGATSTPKASRPIVIGISLSLTGGFAGDGQAFQRGYRLWQSDVNEHGGLLGRPVKLIILNDNTSPAKVAANYRTLITADHVDMTLGPFSSLLTAPAEQAMAKYGYAMIEGAGAAESVYTTPANEKYHNLFSPSLPVALYMKPFIQWIKSLPASERPKTAAYPTVNDPFATPAVRTAQHDLEALGVKTLYGSKTAFTEKLSAYKAPAEAVVATNAQMVVLGSTDVPTVATFMKVFEQNHYNPKIFIAVSGPDQGQLFEGTVGKANANGMMVPDGWYGAYSNALSNAMVEEYIARYGGTAAGINADVAEAFSVGQIAADAVVATGGTNNAKIMRYLHGPVTLQTVQGPARFDKLGRNLNPQSAAFISQWQSGSYVQVLPVHEAGSTAIEFPKPAWGS
ncbi:MAG TPA: ABC transporter substrate-binding protein [Streptosporangiaceae bacterium]|nr:ABC transporter substrate-binding protein [Streptosporangiaceae bacterium]